MSTTVLDFDYVDAGLPSAQIPTSARKLTRYRGNLNYDYYVQNTGYWCGPATAQMILTARGVKESQGVLARKLGTHTGGTDYIGQFPPVLNSYLKDGKYFFRNNPSKDVLWSLVTKSIDAGYAIAANIVAYTYNRPPGYPNYTVWHYVPIMGYGQSGSAKKIFCADSANFSGVKSWWASLDQMTSLVSPKGIAPSGANVDNGLGSLSPSNLATLSDNFKQLGPT